MSLPPEAIAELKRIRLKLRAREAAAAALLASTIYQLLYPPQEPAPDQGRAISDYLSGR